MPREVDRFREYVEAVENKWRCRFCGNKYGGSATRIRAHLAGIPGYGIKECEKVDHRVRAEALQKIKGKGRVLDISQAGTSGEGTERTAFGPSQIVFIGDDASNPNDTQNSNQPGCAPQQPSCHWPTGTGTASACPQHQVSLPPGDMPPDLSNHGFDAARGNEIASSLQQLPMNLPALDPRELPAPLGQLTHLESGREQQNSGGLSSFRNDQVLGESSMSNWLQEFIGDRITPDSPLYSTEWSNLHHSVPENLLESRDEEIQANELHNPTGRSSLQIYSSLDVGSANRLPDCGQPCAVEVVPLRSNTSPTDSVQHPGQLPPRCDKEDGDDTRSQTPMDIDPSTASQLVPEASTNTIGPSSSHDMNEGAPMTSHPNTGNNFEENRALKRKLELLYSKEASIRAELEFAASLSLKKLRMEVANWLAIVEKLRNDCTEAASEDCLLPYQQVDILMSEAEDLSRQGKGLFEARETKVKKLLEETMVGEEFQRNTTKILEYLVGNHTSPLGIYGMGGVGKTTIMVHIHNRLLEKANYGTVLWITVSQDFNTQRLQDAIGKELGLNMLQEMDVRKRAAMLCDCLTKRGKFTIILDDVWERFDLKEVGIPVRANGIKLVLTTRSFKVCRQMDCEQMIKIEPLSHIEAESFFLEELGSEVALNLETKAVVKSIVKECAGLPLAIITMARSMQGVTDVFEWKDSLEKLRESDMGQTDMEKVLMKLEVSYNRLGNHEIQQCFLSCALYPEDQRIHKFELIEFFIDQGLIGRLNTREKQYDRGLTILNKLENVCLLENHGSKMKMHDLIRDMALHVMSATSIVKARKGLRSIPPEEYWTDALEKVSLMENYIREFPLKLSPNCPKLSTFLLNENFSIDVVIPDSFFKQLRGLKVLNLSGCTLRQLPDSISNLVNLRALLLRNCVRLCLIPYLGKLVSLRKLDIFNCAKLEELEGLEMLVNLRYLDLSYTHIRRLPKGTLRALLNLQYLKVEALYGEDIIKLRALETLACSLEDVDDFNKFVRVVSKQRNNPRYYKLKVRQEASEIYVQVSGDARFGNCERSVDIQTWSHAIVSMGGESSGIRILIPQDVQTLSASNCDGTTNLSGMGPLKNLEVLTILLWKNLRVLWGGQDDEIIDIRDCPAPTPTPPLFPSLRNLEIYQCPKLKYLLGHGPKFYLPHLRKIEISNCEEMVGITSSPPHPPPAFPSLEVISVLGCDKMKRVVEYEWLPHFPNLKDIGVCRCENMEEIIGGPPQYMPIEEISLESLRVAGCDNMRKLFPHEWMLHLRNLQTIDVNHCKGMVEMISGAGQVQEGSITTLVNNTPLSFRSSISLPKLKYLQLGNLPQLRSICEVSISCDSMENLVVYGCPELNRIPLQLQLRDIEDLPYIEVEGEDKWKTLIWDHPDAQAILQSHLLFRGNTCVLEGRCNLELSAIGSESPDAAFEEV